MIVVIIMYEILVIMDNIFHTFFVHEPMFVHLDLSDKYARWVHQPLQNSTYMSNDDDIMNVVCHLSVYLRQLMTRDQFPSALRNI